MGRRQWENIESESEIMATEIERRKIKREKAYNE